MCLSVFILGGALCGSDHVFARPSDHRIILTSLGARPQFVEEPSSWTAPPYADRLRALVQKALGGYQGALGLAISDPVLGHRFGYQGSKPMYLASTVKLAFMVGVFRAREQGLLKFSDALIYGVSDIRDGAPRLNRMLLGAQIPISTLLDWMMRSSDNGASDMLAKRVGLERISQDLENEGITGISRLSYMIDVRRGIYRELDVSADDLSARDIRKIRWTKIWQPQVDVLNDYLGKPRRTFSKSDLLLAYDRYYKTGVNSAPMNSMARLFEKLLFGRLVSKTASAEMLELMTETRTSTHRLRGRLPRGTLVAHKTGSQFKRLCDMGIVVLPDRQPLVVAACTEGGGVHESEAVIAQITRSAYDLAHAHHQQGH